MRLHELVDQGILSPTELRTGPLWNARAWPPPEIRVSKRYKLGMALLREHLDADQLLDLDELGAFAERGRTRWYVLVRLPVANVLDTKAKKWRCITFYGHLAIEALGEQMPDRLLMELLLIKCNERRFRAVAG